MKVLQVINSLSAGGAEKLLVDAVVCYRNKGIEVDLLVLNEDKGSPFKERLKSYPQIQVFSLGESISVYNPLLFFKLNKYFKKYDLIHVHLFPSLYWAALYKFLYRSKTKMIFTEHNVTNRRRNIKWFKRIDRFVYRQYDTIITISNSSMRSLENHLGKYYKLITIENGIDQEEIINSTHYSKNELGFKENEILLIQVSSFTPQKNQKFLIETMKYLPDNYHLIFVGDGPLKQLCQEIVKNEGISSRVHFLGLRKDVPRLLKTADLVVLASHYEGLSLSSVEGLISGKPFLASNVPGLTEVVKGGGLLFENDDPMVLSNQILNIMEDKNYYDKVARSCKQKGEIYNIKRMTDQYLKVYLDLLSK